MHLSCSVQSAGLSLPQGRMKVKRRWRSGRVAALVWPLRARSRPAQSGAEKRTRTPKRAGNDASIHDRSRSTHRTLGRRVSTAGRPHMAIRGTRLSADGRTRHRIPFHHQQWVPGRPWLVRAAHQRLAPPHLHRRALRYSPRRAAHTHPGAGAGLAAVFHGHRWHTALARARRDAGPQPRPRSPTRSAPARLVLARPAWAGGSPADAALRLAGTARAWRDHRADRRRPAGCDQPGSLAGAAQRQPGARPDWPRPRHLAYRADGALARDRPPCDCAGRWYSARPGARP